jgi:hypothetical protein
MKHDTNLAKSIARFRGGIVVLMTLGFTASHAATLWTGPNTSWTKSGSTPSDIILAGKVVLTRGSRDVLYNTAAGETGPPLGITINSPADTEWAFGTLANFNTLTYQSLESMRNGDTSALLVGHPMVVHLINEDIYLSLTFSVWGQFGSGTVAYTRSTPPAGSAPTVTITSPAANSFFAASANIPLTATPSANVTNVEYFAGTASLGRATSAPWSVTGTIATPGSYALKAVAKAGGLSGTSSVVNITVIGRPVTTITSPTEGTVFAAPADVKLSVTATSAGGTVTNVTFFGNGVRLGSATTSPFNFTAAALPAGSYVLSAVATAGGIQGTSAVVNVSVVTPLPISLSAPTLSNGSLSFNYTANPGLSYVVQGSADLLNWVPLMSSVAAANPVIFTDNAAAQPSRYYRVGRLPNP